MLAHKAVSDGGAMVTLHKKSYELEARAFIDTSQPRRVEAHDRRDAERKIDIFGNLDVLTRADARSTDSTYIMTDKPGSFLGLQVMSRADYAAIAQRQKACVRDQGRALLCAALIGLSLLATIACKSGRGAGLIPTLGGTPIPTASPIPPTVVVCTLAEPAPLPPNFPAELRVAIPPDMTVYAINTTPYLQIVGRVPPPIDSNGSHPPFGIVAAAVLKQLQGAGWHDKYNGFAAGADWTFTASDGRKLHFNSKALPECSNAVQLTYDLQWIKR
jgi:hypothetical protein